MGSFAFEAKSVASVHPDHECHLVGFADSHFNTTIYLMLQRAFEFDEQDVALGQDTYHLEWCGEEKSSYGGISRFLLGTDSADVAFFPDVAAALDGMDRLFIKFRLSPSEHGALRGALEQIFEGSGVFCVADA